MRKSGVAASRKHSAEDLYRTRCICMPVDSLYKIDVASLLFQGRLMFRDGVSEGGKMIGVLDKGSPSGQGVE